MPDPNATNKPNIGAPGKEQFADAQVTTRNVALEMYIGRLLLFREEFLADDSLAARTGFDDPTLAHYKELLARIDQSRRLITDAGTVDVKKLFNDAKDQNQNLTTQQGTTGVGSAVIRPTIKLPSAPMRFLKYALDGSDANIRLTSQLNIRNDAANHVLTIIDQAISQATRLEDRFLSYYITPQSSLMLWGGLQSIWTALTEFGGADNRILIANGTRVSEEPRGVTAAPNSTGEVSAAGSAAKA